MRQGTLVIDITANVARLEQDMAKAQGVVSGAMRSIYGAANTAKTALGALGVGLGAGAFAYVIKGSIDAADHLNDLSKATSLSVEQLAGLKLAAKQSGGDLDGLAAAINKLSVNMGKDAEKFKALGVSAKDPLEAFKQLSDIFIKIQDPQQRAAVMAEALGKSWASAAPLLAEGGTKIGEMVERGSKLSGVTKEIAEQADQLNDKLAELGGTVGLVTRLIGPMLPVMNSLADSMLKAHEKTDGFKSSISPLAEVLKVLVVIGSDVSFVFQTMGKDIARAAENVQLIAKGDFAGSRALGELFKKDAEAARKSLDEYQAKIMGLSLTGRPGPAAAGVDPAVSADAAARAKDFLGTDNEANAKRAAAAAKAAKEALDAYNKSLENTAKNEDALTKTRQEGAAVEAAASLKRGQALIAGYELADQIEFETKLIGMSNAEREVAIALRDLETKGIRQTDEAYAGLAERMGSVINAKAAREKAKEASESAAKEWNDTFERRQENLTRTISDGLMRGFEKGAKSAAQVVVETLQNALKAAVFEPVIRAIVSPVAGAVTQATMGLFGGRGGGFGNLFSGANNLFGGGNNFLGQASYGVQSALGMNGVAAWGVAEEAAALGIGGLGEAGAATGFGPWGLAAAGALALFGDDLFGGGGGPKPSQLGITKTPGSGYYVSQIDVPGGEANAALYDQLNALLKDPRKYDPSVLAGLTGYLQGGPGESAESMFQKLLAYLEPARVNYDELIASQEQLSESLRSLADSLPDKLGITAVQGYLDSLATSEYVAPMERLSAARELYESTASRALAGDSASVMAAPGLAQQLLGIGRDVYASGSGFQDLFRDVNSTLQTVLDQQRGLQMELMREMPVAIRETSADQLTALKKGFSDMVEQLLAVNDKLRAIEQQAA